MDKCKRFGSSFAFGGKCIVQNIFQSEYYLQPNFFQMVEDNTKLNEVHPSIKRGDTAEAKKLVDRSPIEVNEVDRRQHESKTFERKYSAKFQPNEGAACFSLSFFYRRMDPKPPKFEA